MVVVHRMHYWDQVISGREEGHGKGRRALTCACVRASRQDKGDDKRSALHQASVNGLEGTVAKLLAHGANAALEDEVRACIYVQTG